MFTLDNTEGFTAANIELLNAALAILTARGIEESNASDIVNNNWQGDGSDTVESLSKFGAGRPATVKGRPVNVYLDEAAKAKAVEIGGSVSEGIRIALAAYRAPTGNQQ